MVKFDIKNILGSFKSRKFKFGGYAAMLTASVIAIVIVLNLLVGQIPAKFDLTHNRLYSLSKPTVELLKNLKKDVTIYALFQSGNENPVISEFIQKYADKSSHVKIKYIDPYKNPGFVKKYDTSGSGIDEGSLIVESGNKFRVINRYDMVDYSYDEQTGNTNVTGLTIEQKLTPAILYVTSEKTPIIYELKGHGEDTFIGLGISSEVEAANFEIKDLNLLTEKSVPQDASAVVVISPKTDISDIELKKLKDYINGGGRVLFLMDLLKDELKNFNSIFESLGVRLEHGIVMEGDNTKNAGNPVWILPNLESHDITNPIDLNNMYMLLPSAQPIVETKFKKRTITIEKLLTTTSNSWLRKDLNSTSLSKEKGDISGPFTLAVAITDKADSLNAKLRPRDAKVVIVGSAMFANSQFSKNIPGNLNFVVNALNWLQDKKDTLQIQPKDLTTFRLNLSTSQAMIWAAITVVGIPVLILILGLTIWLRRRHL
ncbi:ABC-type uncharacterized transport system [Caldicellulosiruptor kronotskyensis 2002]|uniref:ABC-type uncharacterized transport system n=1 Tax=Caldicellulosiruptor kronotskyensis (strain DSM 18902 / VKM B-2412 / 2002) TaxID=632348 RepID=E4SCU9_CALK2|nr:GldG family protein [Caldicellulosiruptor kronotskyensis]ADQ45082.1 ABC-type uncharacterized transport system [Caldicellulosiruptor kronotskyensis 2002]